MISPLSPQWIVMRMALGILAGSLVLGAQSEPALKDVFLGEFTVGAALNPSQFQEQDTRSVPLIKKHFNSITPENVLKWERVHPEPKTYAFELPDKYVNYGQKNNMEIVGHTLVWHSQTPAWVFQDEKGGPADRDLLLTRMHEHINTVVGRYKGRIKAWDVVNEALNEDGSMRQTPWMKIIGEDYIAKAFQYAHEADPEAILLYNDYNLENGAKRNGCVALVKKLKAQGVPIHGIGSQGHNKLNGFPSADEQDATLTAFGALGVTVAITELDMDVLPRAVRNPTAEVSIRAGADAKLNPYTAGLPEDVQQTLATRYAELFKVYRKHAKVLSRVTFWGVTDGDSWLNNWPVVGRTSYPLLFDRQGKPKPAFQAVVATTKDKGSTN